MTKAKSKVVMKVAFNAYALTNPWTLLMALDDWDYISKKKSKVYRHKIKITIEEVRGR
jgi:hypothetical protein